MPSMASAVRILFVFIDIDMVFSVWFISALMMVLMNCRFAFVVLIFRNVFWLDFIIVFFPCATPERHVTDRLGRCKMSRASRRCKQYGKRILSDNYTSCTQSSLFGGRIVWIVIKFSHGFWGYFLQRYIFTVFLQMKFEKIWDLCIFAPSRLFILFILNRLFILFNLFSLYRLFSLFSLFILFRSCILNSLFNLFI